jgi:hypothetical protein
MPMDLAKSRADRFCLDDAKRKIEAWREHYNDPDAETEAIAMSPAIEFEERRGTWRR